MSRVKKHGRQPPVLKDQAKRPQGVKKNRPVRKSARLQAIQQLRKQSISKSDLTPGVQTLSCPETSNTPEGRRRPHILHNPLEAARKPKRKRRQEAGHSSGDRLPSKRQRTSPSGRIAEERAAINISGTDPIQYWVCTAKWPKKYFEQDSQVREDLEKDSWLEEQMESSTQAVEYVEINGYRYPRPIKKLPTSLRRKQSDSSLNDSSDQKQRERKSAPYRDTRYTMLLATKGSYLREFDDDDIPKHIEDLCQTLLESDQTVPQDSLFRNDIFKKTCRKIQDRNETMVVRDIGLLIVPSAQTLATYGATHLDHLNESVNEGWNGAIPVQGPRPQPDYSVGFGRSAFTDEQLNKLDPLIGSVYDTSYFVATYQMYFPFLTCEVKCGAAALNVADRQNAHSMTVAVRGIVELFKAVKREKVLHREILAFSISHDHSSVRIYGHYPVIEGDKTRFYRHPIHEFSFTALNGREKWTAYKFTKNVYDVWMPIHLQRICLAIDELPPDITFEVSRSELQLPDDSRLQLSQELEGHLSQQSNADSISAREEDGSLVGSQDITATTSFTQRHEPENKKPRNKRAAEQRS